MNTDNKQLENILLNLSEIEALIDIMNDALIFRINEAKNCSNLLVLSELILAKLSSEVNNLDNII